MVWRLGRLASLTMPSRTTVSSPSATSAPPPSPASCPPPASSSGTSAPAPARLASNGCARIPPAAPSPSSPTPNEPRASLATLRLSASPTSRSSRAEPPQRSLDSRPRTPSLSAGEPPAKASSTAASPPSSPVPDSSSTASRWKPRRCWQRRIPPAAVNSPASAARPPLLSAASPAGRQREQSHNGR